MNKNIEKIFPALGILFIFLGLLAYYNGFKLSGIDGIWWFSYTGLLIIGIGILTKKPHWIASQVNILLIPYLFWNVDFFYVLITGNSLFGLTDYFFTARTLLSQIITAQHLLVIPAALFVLYFKRLKQNDFWKISFVQIIIFFFISRFTNPEININCVFENCLPFEITFIPYEIVWFTGYIAMIFATNLLLVRMFFGKVYK